MHRFFDCLMRAFYGVVFATLVLTSVTAGEPVVVDRGEVPSNPQQPQLAVDGQGTIHVVYGTGNSVRYSRSKDGGGTFSPPTDLPAAQVISLGMRRGPRIAVSEEAICVSVIGGAQGRGRDGDVQVFRSADGGAKWTNPILVNDVAASAREGLHAIAAAPNGDFHCVWLDLRNGRSEIMASSSTDGGRTWQKNTLVYRSPDGSVCECCHPSLAVDGEGRLHVLWRNALLGNRDMYVTTSNDRGQTFGTASKLDSRSWSLKGCPMDGGAIAAIGNRTVAVWRRDKAIYLNDGLQGEKRLGIGEQPWVTLTEQGPAVIWLARRGDAVYLLPPQSDSPRRLAARAADPVIVTGPAGRGPVVAAWESRDGRSFSIVCRVIDRQ